MKGSSVGHPGGSVRSSSGVGTVGASSGEIVGEAVSPAGSSVGDGAVGPQATNPSVIKRAYIPTGRAKQSRSLKDSIIVSSLTVSG